jgi:Domain of unknown function (DUF6379)
VLTDRVIGDGSLRSDAAGFSFDLRIPWYRSLPLSCVERLDVVVDGEVIAADYLRVAFEGRTYALDELAPLYEEWWQMTDAARVSVARQGGLEPGQHELDVSLSLRIPYIIEAGRRLVMRERCVKTLTVDGAR